MSDVTITLPDGSTRAVPVGAPVREVAAGISPRLAKAALAAVVDDRLVDLSWPLQQAGAPCCDDTEEAPPQDSWT